MEIIIVVVVPHWPAVGVNVCVCGPTIAVFIAGGDHVPDIGTPFVELKGKVPGVVLDVYKRQLVNLVRKY